MWLGCQPFLLNIIRHLKVNWSPDQIESVIFMSCPFHPEESLLHLRGLSQFRRGDWYRTRSFKPVAHNFVELSWHTVRNAGMLVPSHRKIDEISCGRVSLRQTSSCFQHCCGARADRKCCCIASTPEIAGEPRKEARTGFVLRHRTGQVST